MRLPDGMLEFWRRHHFDPLADLDSGRDTPHLPFVYLFGRSLFTVSYYGANIYPENWRRRWNSPRSAVGSPESSSSRPLKMKTATADCASPWSWPTTTQADADTIARSIRDQRLRLKSEFTHCTASRPITRCPMCGYARPATPNTSRSV
jgi:phenylacetate-CoA ligase